MPVSEKKPLIGDGLHRPARRVLLIIPDELHDILLQIQDRWGESGRHVVIGRLATEAFKRGLPVLAAEDPLASSSDVRGLRAHAVRMNSKSDARAEPGLPQTKDDDV